VFLKKADPPPPKKKKTKKEGKENDTCHFASKVLNSLILVLV